MKLATTTGDFHGYSNNMAETVSFYQGTGFKLLDMSFYNVIYPDSPFCASGDDWKKSVEEVAEAAEKYGFDFCQAHSPDGGQFTGGEKYDQLILVTKRTIEACAMLGIEQTVVHAIWSPDFTPSMFMQRNKEFYSLFFDDMEKHGVNVLIENGCEINNLHYYLRTGMEMREFLDYANHPLLHACWDTGHAHMRNKEQYDCIKLLGDELYAVHINDNLGKSDSHIPPYFGSCNFDQVIQALLDIDFKRPFTFEVGNSLHNRRKEWIHNGIAINLLGQVPLHLKQQAVALVYQIGKYMLEQYDCFEE